MNPSCTAIFKNEVLNKNWNLLKCIWITVEQSTSACAWKEACKEEEQDWPQVRNWSFSEAPQGLSLSRVAPWKNQLYMWCHPSPAVKPSWNVNFSEAFTDDFHLYLCLISQSCTMAVGSAVSSSLLTLIHGFTLSHLFLSLAQTSLQWETSALLCGSPERQTALPDWWFWLLGTVVAQTEPDSSPGAGAGGGHEPRLSLIGFSRWFASPVMLFQIPLKPYFSQSGFSLMNFSGVYLEGKLLLTITNNQSLHR